MVDPRRPIVPVGGELRPNDKAEGLFPYSPHLPLPPSAFLSRGAPLHRVRVVLPMDTDWESTGLVATYGARPCPHPARPHHSFSHLTPGPPPPPTLCLYRH